MRSLLKLVLVEDGTAQGAAVREERRRRIRVEDYLDHLCAPLLGVVPYEERLALRTETEEHLYALIEDREADGLPAPEATERALREHGEPWRIGEQFVDVWCRSHTPETVFTRYVSAATVRAFAFFGTASVTCILLLQYDALAPSPLRHDALMPWVALLGVLGPLVAGVLTGVCVPVRPARAVAAAMGIVLVHSALAALLMWPQWEGVTLLTAQTIGWLPVGMLCAVVGASVARHLRRTLFLRSWALR